MSNMNKEVEITRCAIPKKIYYCHINYGWYIDEEYNSVPSGCVSNNDWIPHEDRLKGIKHVVPFDSPQKNHIKATENKPFSVRLIGSHRDYKDRTDMCVVDEDNNMFHMAADIFIEAWLHGGIDKDGILNDKFIFAKYGNGLRMIRNNSELHKAIVAYENRKKKTKIDNNELEIGCVYKTPGGQEAVFLGYVTTVAYKAAKVNPSGNLVVGKKIIGKSGLWYDISRLPRPEANLNTVYGKMLKQSHNYVSKVADKKFNIERNIINKIVKSAMDLIERSTKKGHVSMVVDYGKFANMSLYGCHPSFGDKSSEIENMFNINCNSLRKIVIE